MTNLLAQEGVISRAEQRDLTRGASEPPVDQAKLEAIFETESYRSE